MGKWREFCESAKKGHKCIDDLCRGADITLCGFDQDEYDEMTADYGDKEDCCYCMVCDAPFNDGGGLYCSTACEEAANPSGML